MSFFSEGRVREDPGNEENCLAFTFAKANYLGSFDNKPLFFLRVDWSGGGGGGEGIFNVFYKLIHGFFLTTSISPLILR